MVGMFDICYVVASLSGLQALLRKYHLKEAQEILGCIKKYPKRGYIFNPYFLKVDNNYDSNQIRFWQTVQRF